MPIEFKPQTGQFSLPATPPPAPQAPKRRNRAWAWLLAAFLLIGLGAGLAYYVWLADEQQEIIDELTISKEDLESEITQMNDRVAKLDDLLAEANQNLEAKQAEVQELLQRIAYLQSQVETYIRQGRVVEAERNRYQGMYDQLMFYNRKYQREIAELKAENTRLRSQVSTLQVSADSLRDQTDLLRSRVNQAQIQLESSKALVAANWKFIAIKRTREVEGPRMEARDLADKLRVCFNVARNPNTAEGLRSIHLVILGPNSSTRVVHNLSHRLGSGLFNYMGREMIYSAMANIRYNRQDQRVCIDYNLPEGYRFEPGSYTASAYADGFQMGSAEFWVE